MSGKPRDHNHRRGGKKTGDGNVMSQINRGEASEGDDTPAIGMSDYEEILISISAYDRVQQMKIQNPSSRNSLKVRAPMIIGGADTIAILESEASITVVGLALRPRWLTT